MCKDAVEWISARTMYSSLSFPLICDICRLKTSTLRRGRSKRGRREEEQWRSRLLVPDRSKLSALVQQLNPCHDRLRAVLLMSPRGRGSPSHPRCTKFNLGSKIHVREGT